MKKIGQVTICVITLSGLEEAASSGRTLSEGGFKFDVAFTSVLTRAEKTLEVILGQVGQPDLPVVRSWKLNERHYGSLTGMDKEETKKKHGAEQVQVRAYSYVRTLLFDGLRNDGKIKSPLIKYLYFEF